MFFCRFVGIQLKVFCAPEFYTSVYKTCRNVTETSQMADGVVGWLVVLGLRWRFVVNTKT